MTGAATVAATTVAAVHRAEVAAAVVAIGRATTAFATTMTAVALEKARTTQSVMTAATLLIVSRVQKLAGADASGSDRIHISLFTVYRCALGAGSRP